ncbi:ABC-three component system middle component 6 [Listeria immobilis]|uniref:ABC-three component system middle component 6 n=1 Tax=Listeria immobilis TaxID=2713502 RepID=UPI0035E39D6B
MLINKDAKPKDTVLYISACVLDIASKRCLKVDNLYQKVKEIYNIDIDYPTFLLALYFLFLLEKVNFNQEELLCVY